MPEGRGVGPLKSQAPKERRAWQIHFVSKLLYLTQGDMYTVHISI